MWTTIVLAVWGIYNAISFFFLMNPDLLHKHKDRLLMPTPTHHGKYIHAHKGGGDERPENSVQAYTHAKSLGITMLDTDVRLAQDNVLITIHDDNFMRTAGVSDLVVNTPSTSMPLMKDKVGGYDLQPSDSRAHTTLEQLFQAISSTDVLQIELKDIGNSVSRTTLVNLIQTYNRESTTIVGGSSSALNAQFRSLDSTIPIFMPSDSVLKYFILYITGLLPFFPIEEDVASLPYMYQERVHYVLNENPGWYGYLNVVVIWIMSHLCDPMIKHFNKRGIYTHYWTINYSTDLMREVLSTSIQGMLTDRLVQSLGVLNSMS
ncbi:glycerophosphodiester phosphodiesterase domain-containing protein 1 [Stylonychia lemnae]|uniref:Glycerophosphodiester phosphodiesterase domain-containing protein 1 n=1 Tax=Stylonychia lemnae TaxID=5949 RepID=A0A078A3T0_STYLE|nr:glycerophosphodiester phosphodiesterase domain-containing protein 1 [Stylonychia lemnae]|eukprot:CDW75409.1 glycerophosphodiester phosphodiesterase domain-containing protein 1 [Stylonychia lemnae]